MDTQTLVHARSYVWFYGTFVLSLCFALKIKLARLTFFEIANTVRPVLYNPLHTRGFTDLYDERTDDGH